MKSEIQDGRRGRPFWKENQNLRFLFQTCFKQFPERIFYLFFFYYRFLFWLSGLEFSGFFFFQSHDLFQANSSQKLEQKNSSLHFFGSGLGHFSEYFFSDNLQQIFLHVQAISTKNRATNCIPRTKSGILWFSGILRLRPRPKNGFVVALQITVLKLSTKYWAHTFITPMRQNLLFWGTFQYSRWPPAANFEKK